MMNATRLNSLTVRTPEGITFGFLLASPVIRFFAYAIDLACILAIFSAFRVIVLVFSIASLDFGIALQTVLLFALQIGYGMGWEWLFRGQTPGKRLLRLRVIDAEGLQLQFYQIVIRNLLRAADSLPALYLVGAVAAWFSPRGQRLGDIAANTVVTRIVPIETPHWDQVLAGKFNSLRDYPHLEARLRQQVRPVELSLAIQALLRRDQFDARARTELFAQLGAHFRALVVFPPEAVSEISDEQYLRNVVDSVLRPRRK